MQALRTTSPRPAAPAVKRNVRTPALGGAWPIPVFQSPETGAFALLVGATAIFNQYCAIQVMKARKTYNVAFPRLYAEGDSPSAVKFNCVQRSHQQWLENLPLMAFTTMILAQAAPRFAAGMYAIWFVGRVLYAKGYSSGDPKGRVPGAAISSLTALVGMITAVVWGAKTLLA